jgi:hypothetical protein
MSTHSQIQSIRRIEQHCPVDLICNGHTYISHHRGPCAEAVAIRRHMLRLKPEYRMEVIRLYRMGNQPKGESK